MAELVELNAARLDIYQGKHMYSSLETRLPSQLQTEYVRAVVVQ